MTTSPVFAASWRKLTGTARGGAFDIARHSLPREVFCAAAGAIARLRTLLKASNVDAEESFHSLQNVVAGVIEKVYLDGLSASINDFDFDAALEKLDEIAERLARNGVTHEPGRPEEDCAAGG